MTPGSADRPPASRSNHFPMPTYDYTCIDARSGKETTGRIDGNDRSEALAQLRSRGLHLISFEEASSSTLDLLVKTKSAAGVDLRRARMSRAALGHFTRQLASLLRAGMPLVRGLDVLARQAGRRPQGRVIRELADAVRGGAALSTAMEGVPRCFPVAYVAMIRAGEAGGVLETVVERLGQFLDKGERLRRRVRAALVYPAMIALVAGGVVAALLVFVVPKFEAVFASLLKGQSLPALTEAVLAAGKFFQANGLVVLVVPILMVVVCTLILRLRGVRIWRDRLMLALPAVGGLVTKTAVAHLSRTLGTLLGAGVPILPALLITRDTGDNLCIEEAMTRIHDRVQAGDPIASPFAGSGIFPELVPSMIEVGEETGALPEMFLRVADTYDDEVDAAVAALTSMLEPLTIAVMAVVVGTIVIAMFLPIVRIIQTLS